MTDTTSITNRRQPPTIISIAGTDPSGGAGIQADIKAISANGGYAATIITSLVAQNTQGVVAIESISWHFIQQQLDAVFTDLTIDAIKIGMLENSDIIQLIANHFKQMTNTPIILDPVMFAKDGSPLLAPQAIETLKQCLLPEVTLITPNLPELECLANQKIITRKEMEYSVISIAEQYKLDVLAKGGHFKSSNSPDCLILHNSQHVHWFENSRIDTSNTHGTGCSLSAAIATHLGFNQSITDAVTISNRYLHNAIYSAKDYKIGQGSGPIDHFYFI